MARQQVQFRGLNTDLPAERLPTGTAIVATNVIMRDGQLQKRAGFDQWEDDVTGSADGILNIFVAKFANGTTYVVCKMDDGFLWHREVGQTSFTKITDKYGGHTADEAGSFYMAADRMYYFDTNGGSKWTPVVSTYIWKAGIDAPSAKPTVSATTGGQKDGRYHYFTAFRNSVTGEESLISIPSSSVTCAADGNNAIDVTAAAISANFEADQYIGFSTLGAEYLGKGSGAEVFSFKAYRDKINSDNTWDAKKADAVLDKKNRFSMKWGLPPAADIVAYDGDRAIYAGATAGIIHFSIHGFPAAVPKFADFSMNSGDNTQYLDPEPYQSWITSGFNGDVTELAFGGGVFGLYTDHEMYVLLENPTTGRMQPRRVRTGRGCVVHQAAVGTVEGIHAIGYRSWTVLSSAGIRDLSHERFVTTLETIPVASQTKTRMAEFSFQDQVWASVVGSGETYAQNILVWDRVAGGIDNMGRRIGALSIFEIEGMAATEDITAMCELAYATAEPTMLVGTDAGRILQYPSLVGDDALAGTRTHYAAEWRGYIATEGLRYSQYLNKVRIHAGSNVQTDVVFSYRNHRTGDETLTPKNITLDRCSKRITLGPMNYENPNGHFFEIGFSTTKAVDTIWTISDMMIEVARTAD